ncbi:MAG TPA: MSMEG_0570 family nitrogen starvation response protein [Polyangiales bacterium]|nr:MSMEG_0570 family nitrogen starvation response protein [Polyangiales bacterium]
MPEVHFDVRWPDGARCTYYSPSTAIHRHLRAGETYKVPEFLEKARAALHEASERVRAKYGYTCSSAMDTLSQIEETAQAFAGSGQAQADVTIVALSE